MDCSADPGSRICLLGPAQSCRQTFCVAWYCLCTWGLLLSPPLLAALHGAEMGQPKALVLTDVLLKSVLYYFLCQSFAVSAFFNTLGNWAWGAEISVEALLAFLTSSLSGLLWEVLNSLEPFDMGLLQPELVCNVLVFVFPLLENRSSFSLSRKVCCFWW